MGILRESADQEIESVRRSMNSGFQLNNLMEKVRSILFVVEVFAIQIQNLTFSISFSIYRISPFSICIHPHDLTSSHLFSSRIYPLSRSKPLFEQHALIAAIPISPSSCAACRVNQSILCHAHMPYALKSNLVTFNLFIGVPISHRGHTTIT